jgi:hypothetical protein
MKGRQIKINSNICFFANFEINKIILIRERWRESRAETFMAQKLTQPSERRQNQCDNSFKFTSESMPLWKPEFPKTS